MVKIKADLHEHLQTSSVLLWNSFAKDERKFFSKTFKTALRRLGSGGLFGLVDFGDKRYKQFIEMRGNERDYIGDDKRAVRIYGDAGKNVVCVHGDEIITKQGHLLVMGMGYETHLKHYHCLEDTIKETRDYNPDAVIIADHPFFIHGIGEHLIHNQDLINEIDAIEGFNGEACFGFPVGPFPFRANQKAEGFYSDVKRDFPALGFISSSDGHSFYEFCRCWSEIDKPNYSSGEEFSKTFRESVRNTNKNTICMKNNLTGIVGAVDHIMDIILLEKIGIQKYLKTGIQRDYEE